MSSFFSRTAILLAAISFVIVAAPAQALMIARAPLADRVATAGYIITGKVKSVEEKTVSALPYPGAPNKEEFTVVVVDVDEGLVGAKGVTRIRLGYLAPPVVNPGGGIRPPLRRRSLTFSVGQEGAFFLQKHPEEDFFIVTNMFGYTDKKTPNYDKELENLHRCVKLLDSGAEGLKSKEAADRLLTAQLLLGRYRSQFGVADPAKQKTEPIAAEESKLILETLANADWTAKDEATGASAQMAFFRLGLTEKDGWKPGPFKAPNDLPDAAKKWLKENAGTYRIQRFVAEEKK